MTLTNKLLTAVYVTVPFKRNIHITLFHSKIRIHHMTTIPLPYLLIKNLRRQASAPEILFSTYLDLLESNASQKIHKKFRKTIMEPYFNTCYGTVNHITTEMNASVNISLNQINFVSHSTSSNTIENVQASAISENESSHAKQTYRAMRDWKKVGRGIRAVNPEESCIIRLFSYNILAQHLIEMHSYLYKHHDHRSLNWEVRKKLLIEEIFEAQATVICLQEMQASHLDEFVKPFAEKGYKFLYKKRTNDKEDGLLMMYRSDVFNLVESIYVEFFQPGIEILSRDNVAIIAKLSLKDSPQTEVVIATTHLLYNPRRNDVRLGQTQILMAELERIAFLENGRWGPKYRPIILAGDFNLQPNTGVYEFITRGRFHFMGRSRTLGPPNHHKLSNSLIPPHLHVTDGCQHYNILVKRLRNRGDGQVMLENSENPSSKNILQYSAKDQYKKVEVDVRKSSTQQIEIIQGHYVSFGAGQLTHPFNLRSVYSHKDCNGQNEATTHQDGWVTVDYIFFSDLEVIEKYSLPTQKECKILSRIPNPGIGSDHLSLGATFVLHKKRPM